MKIIDKNVIKNSIILASIKFFELIPNILKIESDKIDVFLVSFHNFIGETYPSIGIRNKTGSEKIILEYFDIEEENNFLKATLDAIPRFRNSAA